jgi:hypothetical protein
LKRRRNKVKKKKKINLEEVRTSAVNANALDFKELGLMGGDTLINLCGHEIYALIDGVEGTYAVRFPPYQKMPRVVQERRPSEARGCYTLKNKGITNMPKKMRGIRYIVSLKVLEAVQQLHPNRDDFVAPGVQLRDKNNKVVACHNFIEEVTYE